MKLFAGMVFGVAALVPVSALAVGNHGSSMRIGGRTMPAVSHLERSSSDPTDSDGDGIPNANDNCPSAFNPDQQSAGPGATGDACLPFQNGGPSLKPAASQPAASAGAGDADASPPPPSYGCSVAPAFGDDDTAPQMIALGAIAILIVWAGGAWRSADASSRRSP